MKRKNFSAFFNYNNTIIGDQVMVGFGHNQPDQPFVMGEMFHEQVEFRGGADNHDKSKWLFF